MIRLAIYFKKTCQIYHNNNKSNNFIRKENSTRYYKKGMKNRKYQKRLEKGTEDLYVRNEELPEFNVDGSVVTEKKVVDKKLIMLGVGVAVILGIIYMPQFFVGRSSYYEYENAKNIEPDYSAVRLSANTLRYAAAEDYDSDGLTNADEAMYGTNPWFIDTDDDGVTDYCEVYITVTNPLVYEDTLLKYTENKNAEEGKSYSSPYQIGNVILWADNEKSKAYGSIIETITGYHVCNFDGYIKVSEDKLYVYRNSNGTRELLEYNEAANAWKVSAGDYIEIYDEPLEYTVETKILGAKFYLDYGTVSGFLAKILPNYGPLSAQRKTIADVDPEINNYTLADIEKPEYDALAGNRFKLNSINISDLTYVRSIISDGHCVSVSLYNDNIGEYIGIVYGYDEKGNLFVADEETLEPAGMINITVMAEMIYHKDGIVSRSYYDFEGFGFSSQTGSRISFFAVSEPEKEPQSVEDTKNEAEKTTEATTAPVTTAEATTAPVTTAEATTAPVSTAEAATAPASTAEAVTSPVSTDPTTAPVTEVSSSAQTAPASSAAETSGETAG